ncbi:hypothetical protein CAPTEDRAFT_40798, partial [Capitella teleta]
PGFTAEGVARILTQLNANKACAPNGIFPVILTKFAHLLSPSLTVLFNILISSKTVPDEWKKSYIVQVFKKGDKQNVKNYRPISLYALLQKFLSDVFL